MWVNLTAVYELHKTYVQRNSVHLEEIALSMNEEKSYPLDEETPSESLLNDFFLANNLSCLTRANSDKFFLASRQGCGMWLRKHF